MKNGHKPAIPLGGSHGIPTAAEAIPSSQGTMLVGLTKRELFAAMAMSAAFDDTCRWVAEGDYYAELGRQCVGMADALLTALEGSDE